MMSKTFGFLAALALVGQGGMSAEESKPSWDSMTAWSSYVEFVTTNEARIVNLTNIGLRSSSQILGLDVADAPPANWSSLGRELTHVVCLRITSNSRDVPSAIFAAITNYPRLEYVHLQCRQALTIPEDVHILSSLPHLRYLGIDAPSATNIAAGIYQAETIKELFLVAGSVRIPDGITRLSGLVKLSIYGKRTRPIQSLPADLPRSAIRRLEVANISGVDKLLPILPPDLVEFSVLNCQLCSVPNAWIEVQKLQVIDLSNNDLSLFPTGLLRMPSLKLIGLDLNNITNVPPLNVADDRQLKVSLIGNPIQHFAPENKPLIERGVIEK